MKLPTEPSQPDQTPQPAGHRHTRRRGVALILVVMFIVLLSALVVGFFSRVTSELAGARAYAEGVSARHLADSAVSVVMGQIRAATTIKNGCWASQPGMIRVYGTGTNPPSGQVTPSAQAYAFYKLYSSHNMVVSGTDLKLFDPANINPNSGASSEVPIGTGGWLEQPAFFTDLNEPVDVPDPTPGAGKTATIKRFPIFDPAVARIAVLNQNTSNNSPGSVEGCELTLPLGNDLQRTENGIKVTYAPMPVRWLYVLRDGTLTAPTQLTGPASGNSGIQAFWGTTGSGGTATGVPTKDNPIVGRIAFWADDDTSKVNINTAGGYLLPDGVSEDVNLDNSKPSGNKPETNPAFYAGSFWDTPRVQTVFDRGLNTEDLTKFIGGLANSQPIQNEFHRYPGHPSTTSLGLVLKNLLPTGKTGFDSSKLYQMGARLSYRGNQVDLNNKVVGTHRGSEGGTRRLEPKVEPPLTYGVALAPDDPLNNLKDGTPGDLPMLRKAGYSLNPPSKTDPTATVDSDPYHLLGSVDELFYTTLIDKAQKPGANRQLAENVIGIKANSITPRLVDQTRFFLTTHSRSPETNLFGRPRVAIWPVSTAKSEGTLVSEGIRNLSDDMIRFCSTVGAKINWADNSDGVGRPGQFIFDREDPLSSTSDFDRKRNKEVFAYLHDLTSNTNGKIPGFGQSFQSKYSGGPLGQATSDQILTEIFDYIRSVNLKDTSRDRAINDKYPKVDDKFTPTNLDRKQLARYATRGIIVPTRVKATGASGFGRFPTISEASLVFYHGGYLVRPKKTAANPNPVEDVQYDWRNIPKSDANTATIDQWSEKNDLTGIIVRAFVIFETFNPMQGYGPVTNFSMGAGERIIYEITNLADFQIKPNVPGPGGVPAKYQSLELGKGKNNVWRSSGSTYGGRNFGGTEGFFHTLQDKTYNVAGVQPYPWGGAPNGSSYEKASGLSALTLPSTNAYYPFQTPCQNKFDGVKVRFDNSEKSPAVKIDLAQQTFDFQGGQMEVTIRYQDAAKPGIPAHDELTQTIALLWPSGNGWPLPITERDTPSGTPKGQALRQVYGGFDPTMVATPAFDAQLPAVAPDFPPNLGIGGNNWTNSGGFRMSAYLPLRIAWCALPDYNPYKVWNWKTGEQTGGDGKHYAGRYLNILQPGDTIRSMVPGGTNAAATDPRAIHLQQKVTTFQAHPEYNKPGARRAQTLRFGSGGFYFEPADEIIFPGGSKEARTGSLVTGDTRYGGTTGPDLPKKIVAAQFNGQAADFDTGIGNFPDGPYCNKADEGNIVQVWYDLTKQPGTAGWQNWVEPYFSTWVYNSPLDTYFSPNRQIPSPVMFGSLLAPQAGWNLAGWKTLLFCPNPAASDPSKPHPGTSNPPDHLLLDLFSMPVVEPYAISEPFSTDGKVNLNYQLMPFGYIKRSTALRAALHPLRVTAIPNSLTKAGPGGAELCYKTTNQNGQTNPENLRYLIDRDETLKAFDAFFGEYSTDLTRSKGFFKSASQICERFLYPKGVPNKYVKVNYAFGEAPIRGWWNSCAVTGDNVREKPYSDLYSRVTTKSNTFTVHYRVQSLRQRPYTGNAAGEAQYYQSWDESRDKVLSEYRGHTTIERFLDPVDPRLDPDPNSTSPGKINVHKQSLEDAYRFRVVYNKRFSPW